MNKTKLYYQPELYFDEGTNIGWGIPSEITSFQAFASREDCIEFMEMGGYKQGDYIIREYHDEDIEGVTILDNYGNVIETNESLVDEVIRITEPSLVDELIVWAEDLKSQYDNAETNGELAILADKMADFLDAFIERAEEI